MRDPTVAENLRLSGIPSVYRADPFPVFGHAADHLLRTLKLERPELPDLWVRENEDVIVHCGSGSTKKIWPHFDQLLEHVLNAVVLRESFWHDPLPPALRGAALPLKRGRIYSPPPEGETASKASGGGRTPSDEERSFRVLENLSLREISQRLRHCAAYIGNDTGITHLAAYLGCPTIALFGPTDPRVWGPLGRRSRIFWKSKLEDITVDEVLLALHGTHARTRIDG
jgi:hypothetical protein